MIATRKISSALFALSCALFLLGAAPQPKPEKKQTETPGTQAPQRPRPVVYKPPRRGAPQGRVGGGSRGPGDERPVLLLLVPDHTGLTIQESPDLFWYISPLPDHPIELTVNDVAKIEPLIEVRLERPAQPGIQRIRLSDYGLHLKPGVTYDWFVALVVDPDSRSKDIIAGGWLERIEPSRELEQKRQRAATTELPFIYASAGIWYDALQTLSDLINASPDDPVLRQQRAALLEQVGLTAAAKNERTRAQRN